MKSLELIKSNELISTVAFFTKEVNPRSAKRPLIFNGRLANRGLISLVKEATVYASPYTMDYNMMASSSGKIFCVTDPLGGNPPVASGFPS